MQGLAQAARLHVAQQGAAAGHKATLGSKGSQVPRTQPPGEAGVTRGQRARAVASLAPPAPVSAALPAEREEPPGLAPEQQGASPEKSSVNDCPLVFKFLLPNAVVGSMLGRSAANVSRILEATGAYPQFSKPGTAVASARDRMLILGAPSAAAAADALRMLLEAAEADGQLGALGAHRAGGARLALRQVIPPLAAGAVMGFSGEHLKATAAETGCNVVVLPKPANAAFTPFRLVSYLAPGPAELAAGAARTMAAMAQDPRYAEGIREINSTACQTVPLPSKRVGRLLGPGGAHIKALQDLLRVRMGITDPQPGAGGRGSRRFLTVHGPPAALRVAMDVVAYATRAADGEAAAAPAGDGGSWASGSEANFPPA